MLSFQYTAHTLDGDRRLSAHCMAENTDLVRAKLKRIGYVLDSIQQVRSEVVMGRRRKVTLQGLVSLCRRLAVMVGAGLPLVDSLESLAEESDSPDLSAALHRICEDIRSGVGLADAFAKHPNVFSPLFISMVRVGEATAKFEDVLMQLASYLEREMDLRRRLRQAMAYPVVVGFMIVLVVTAIMLVVMPIFAKIYTKLGIPLPVPTRILITLSQHTGTILPVLIIAGGTLFLIYRRSGGLPRMAETIDRLKLACPLAGPLYRNVLLLRFLRTLGITLRAGVHLDEAIRITGDVAGNRVVRQAADMIQQSARHGATLTEAVRLHGFFPQSIVHAFAAGEESGKLDEMLARFADGVEQDVDDGIRKLIMQMEPILVVILSAVIGFVLLAIYLPIFDLMKGFQQ